MATLITSLLRRSIKIRITSTPSSAYQYLLLRPNSTSRGGSRPTNLDEAFDSLLSNFNSERVHSTQRAEERLTLKLDKLKSILVKHNKGNLHSVTEFNKIRAEAVKLRDEMVIQREASGMGKGSKVEEQYPMPPKMT